MHVALGSDMKTDVTTALEGLLRDLGHDLSLYGALGQDEAGWPHVGHAVGQAVARGQAQCGIVCCWSGTGVSIAANKIRGVRAALCTDSQTAGLARTWNDANVLALSLRSLTRAIAQEILDAWFAGRPTGDPTYRPMIDQVE